MIWSHPLLCPSHKLRTWTPWCIYTCWSSLWTFLKLLKILYARWAKSANVCTRNWNFSIISIKGSSLDHINGTRKIVARVNWIVHFWYMFYVHIHRVINSKVDKLKQSVFQNLEHEIYRFFLFLYFFFRNVSLGIRT